MTFVIGDRLSYSGELCTIKFVGDIPPWPNDVSVGVEWDNVQKGKHDGSYKGKKYFESELYCDKFEQASKLTDSHSF